MSVPQESPLPFPTPREPASPHPSASTVTGELSQAIVETIREALLVLDQNFRVLLANRSFYELFQVDKLQTLGRLVYDLGNGQWDIPRLHQLLEEILPQHRVITDFEVTHRFEQVGERTMLLNAQALCSQSRPQLILMAIADITQRKRDEVAIRESDDRFRALLEASSDAIYRMGPDWTEMRFLIGREFIPDTTAPSRSWLQRYIHPDDHEKVMAFIRRAVRTKNSFELEHRVLRRDGSIGWTHSRAVPILDNSGSILEWLGMAKDVTRQKQDQEAIRLREQELDLIVSHYPGLVGRLNREIRYSYVSSLCEEWYGLPPSSVLGRTMKDVIGPQAYSTAVPFAELALSGKPVNFENQISVKAGHDRWVMVSLVPITDATGAVAGFFEFMTDITHRKQAEETLRASEARYRMLFDTMAEGLAVADVVRDSTGQTVDIHYLELNRGFEAQTGMRCERLLGKRMSEVFPQADIAKWLPSCAQVVDTGHSVTFETYVQLLERWYEISVYPRGGDQISVFYQDITQRKLAEQRIGADLDAMTRLQELGTQYVREGDISAVLQSIVDTAIAINSANCGNIWLVNALNGGLIVMAQRGFPQWWVDRWSSASRDSSLRGKAHESLQRVIIEDIERSSILSGTEELDLLQNAGLKALVATPLISRGGRLLGIFSTYYNTPHCPDDRNLKLLDLLARQAADIIDRHNAEKELRDREERLQSILDAAADAIINVDLHGMITSVNAAAVKMFGYERNELIGQNVRILMPKPFCDEHDLYLSRFLETREAHVIGVGREAMGKRKDDSVFPIDLSVNEVDNLGLFTGIIRDITERKSLQRDILAIVDEEQRRIGQDLHDSVQQELAGIQLVTQALKKYLKSEIEHLPAQVVSYCCDMASKVDLGVSRAHREIREIARGLVSLPLDSSGLMHALEQLSRHTNEIPTISCVFRCKNPIEISDSDSATQLYRITQEAVTNALKHACPRHIVIELFEDQDQIILQVADDGKGMDENSQVNGMGIKTMRYRAGLIGGTLLISPNAGGGTLVTCSVFKG